MSEDGCESDFDVRYSSNEQERSPGACCGPRRRPASRLNLFPEIGAEIEPIVAVVVVVNVVLADVDVVTGVVRPETTW